MKNKVCAIIVCYKVKEDLLMKVLNSLENQVSHIYIYDNSVEESSLIKHKSDFIDVYSSGENMGIAYAQNFLVKKAVKDNYKYSLFSDQDTIYPCDYVSQLLSHLNEDYFSGVSPCYLNKYNNTKSSLTILNEHGRISRCHDDKNHPVIHCISSGMIISNDTFLSLGGNNESLFIDWVDNDFCWRAYLNGKPILGIHDVVIEHNLGEMKVIIFGREFTKRNVVRDYYIIRNSIYLLIYNYWGVTPIRNYLLKKIIHHCVFSIISSENKCQAIKYSLRAVNNGIFKKMGRL